MFNYAFVAEQVPVVTAGSLLWGKLRMTYGVVERADETKLFYTDFGP